jgi:hypothetical protein
MYIDWITWSIWGFGFILLAYWCFNTFREFRSLFKGQTKPEVRSRRNEQ